MRSTPSAESAASLSGSSGPESTPSPSAKRTDSAAPSSPDAGPAFHALTTFEDSPQTDWLGLDESICSRAEFLASRRALREADEEAPTSAGYGLRSLTLYEYLAPRGSWRRILSDSLALSLTGCTGSAGHFETSVTSRGRSSSPLTTWVPHTCGGESGSLLPTPSASSYGTTNNGQRGDGTTYRTAGTPSLETMARHNLWPTPTAGDSKSSGSRNTPESQAHPGTSLTDAVRGDGGTGRIRGEQKLSARAKNWSTPIARDAGTYKQAAYMPGHTGGEQLTRQVGGTLNPTWVEWLMGFPLGWTALEPWAMPASRKSSKRSGGRSSKRAKRRE
jgi:hypothetical protein